MIQRFGPNEEAHIDVSADRRVLYIVSYARRPIGSGAARFEGARLRIFDVSEPRAPRQLSELPLGEIAPQEIAARGGHLFFLHWNDERAKQPRGLIIVDVTDPRRPVIASNTPVDGWQLDLNRDGTFAKIATRPRGEMRLKIPLSGQPTPTDETSDGLEPIEGYRQPDMKEVRGVRPFDRAGSRVLTGDLIGLFVSELGTGEPKLLQVVALGVMPYSGRFLVIDGAIAVTDARGIELVSIAPRQYDARRLRETHRRLVEEYGEYRKRKGSAPDDALAAISPYGQSVSALRDAGVDELLGNAGGQVPPAARIQILNDYGFWLNRAGNSAAAASVLSKVVELDPKRAVAWSNLVDAARTAIPFAGTWKEKRTLSEAATTAIATHARLTGKELPGASEFASFNIANASADDVCAYVAAFYNRGRQTEIFGYPDPVDITGDGKPVHVYIYHQGTANVPSIVASTKELDHDEVFFGSPTSEVDFYLTDRGDTWGLEPRVVPFKDAYYVVYENAGPYLLIRPDHGKLCTFKPSYTPVLLENHSSTICEAAVAGKPFEPVPTEKLSPGAIPPAHTDLVRTDSAQFDAVVEVSLTPGAAPARVGYFGIASGAGAGCDMSGVAILDGHEIEDSPRSRALMAMQKETLDCTGSAASLVRAEGETLIEVVGGPYWRGRSTPPRALFRLRGEKVEPVCRVDQRPEFLVVRLSGSRP